MKIGIFYICTGKYSIFWNTFYDSCEKHFAREAEKTYFVFTDDSEIKPSENIKTYYEAPKGFPLDSLLRYKMFLNIKDDTKECDYLFYFNANNCTRFYVPDYQIRCGQLAGMEHFKCIGQHLLYF